MRASSHFYSPYFDNDFEGAKVRHHTEHETTQGREVQRLNLICPVPEDLPDREQWKNLKAIGAVVSISQRGEKEHVEIRYDILSRDLAGRKFGARVRAHWGVENNLLWQQDVTFSEDQCRIRKGRAGANFSLLRRTASSLLKNEKTAKVGIKNKRLTAA